MKHSSPFASLTNTNVNNRAANVSSAAGLSTSHASSAASNQKVLHQNLSSKRMKPLKSAQSVENDQNQYYSKHVPEILTSASSRKISNGFQKPHQQQQVQQQQVPEIIMSPKFNLEQENKHLRDQVNELKNVIVDLCKKNSNLQQNSAGSLSSNQTNSLNLMSPSSSHQSQKATANSNAKSSSLASKRVTGTKSPVTISTQPITIQNPVDLKAKVVVTPSHQHQPVAKRTIQVQQNEPKQPLNAKLNEQQLQKHLQQQNELNELQLQLKNLKSKSPKNIIPNTTTNNNSNGRLSQTLKFVHNLKTQPLQPISTYAYPTREQPQQYSFSGNSSFGAQQQQPKSTANKSQTSKKLKTNPSSQKARQSRTPTSQILNQSFVFPPSSSIHPDGQLIKTKNQAKKNSEKQKNQQSRARSSLSQKSVGSSQMSQSRQGITQQAQIPTNYTQQQKEMLLEQQFQQQLQFYQQHQQLSQQTQQQSPDKVNVTLNANTGVVAQEQSFVSQKSRTLTQKSRNQFSQKSVKSALSVKSIKSHLSQKSASQTATNKSTSNDQNISSIASRISQQPPQRQASPSKFNSFALALQQKSNPSSFRTNGGVPSPGNFKNAKTTNFNNHDIAGTQCISPLNNSNPKTNIFSKTMVIRNPLSVSKPAYNNNIIDSNGVLTTSKNNQSSQKPFSSGQKSETTTLNSSKVIANCRNQISRMNETLKQFSSIQLNQGHIFGNTEKAAGNNATPATQQYYQRKAQSNAQVKRRGSCVTQGDGGPPTYMLPTISSKQYALEITKLKHGDKESFNGQQTRAQSSTNVLRSPIRERSPDSTNCRPAELVNHLSSEKWEKSLRSGPSTVQNTPTNQAGHQIKNSAGRNARGADQMSSEYSVGCFAAARDVQYQEMQNEQKKQQNKFDFLQIPRLQLSRIIGHSSTASAELKTVQQMSNPDLTKSNIQKATSKNSNSQSNLKQVKAKNLSRSISANSHNHLPSQKNPSSSAFHLLKSANSSYKNMLDISPSATTNSNPSVAYGQKQIQKNGYGVISQKNQGQQSASGVKISQQTPMTTSPTGSQHTNALNLTLNTANGPKPFGKYHQNLSQMNASVEIPAPSISFNTQKSRSAGKKQLKSKSPVVNSKPQNQQQLSLGTKTKNHMKQIQTIGDECQFDTIVQMVQRKAQGHFERESVVPNKYATHSSNQLKRVSPANPKRQNNFAQGKKLMTLTTDNQKLSILKPKGRYLSSTNQEHQDAWHSFTAGNVGVPKTTTACSVYSRAGSSLLMASTSQSVGPKKSGSSKRPKSSTSHQPASGPKTVNLKKHQQNIRTITLDQKDSTGYQNDSNIFANSSYNLNQSNHTLNYAVAKQSKHSDQFKPSKLDQPVLKNQKTCSKKQSTYVYQKDQSSIQTVELMDTVEMLETTIPKVALVNKIIPNNYCACFN